MNLYKFLSRRILIIIITAILNALISKRDTPVVVQDILTQIRDSLTSIKW